MQIITTLWVRTPLHVLLAVVAVVVAAVALQREVGIL
jgi:hypothetical protein